MSTRNRQRARLMVVLPAALSIVLLCAETASAGSGFRRSGAKFLLLGAGGRALAMAETYVVEAADPFVIFYNPAAPAGGRPTRLGLAHNEHFQSSHGEYAALTVPAGRLGVGIGLQYFAVNNIPQRVEPTAEPLSEFDASDALLLGAVSYGISEKVRVGLSVKGVFEKIGSKVANGVAFDLGGTYRATDRLAVGAAFNHLGPEMSFDRGSYRLPGIFRLGGAYSTSDWTMRGELVSPNDEPAKFHLGGEYVFNLPVEGGPAAIAEAYLALRAGCAFGYDTRSWAVGFGIGIDYVQVDYAFVPYRSDLGNTHRFGVLFTLQ